MRYQSIKQIAILGLAITGLAALPNARADVLPPGPGGYPDLPPAIGDYRASLGELHAQYGIYFLLNSAIHHDFAVQYAPPQPGYTAIESFGSLIDLTGEMNYGGTWIPFAATNVSAPTTIMITGLSTPGQYSTEMLAMNISVSSPFGPIMIREDPRPGYASTGQTTFTPATGGYKIDSFFDVYTELSLDGGANWIPDDNGPIHVSYENCPEPASTALLGIGLAGLVVMYRRGRKG
jgi:hypothetical protein